MYKIEYDESFPGFRLTYDDHWCDTKPDVKSCLELIARREGIIFQFYATFSESMMLDYLKGKHFIDIEIVGG